ncbi:hypothetical protein KIW84_011982 [Lathyrus oleraceus]|uniref:Uncharacterized protein n=1 Tax=Pisum sativum TaxID=3888 RepID=A0A9D5GVH2_PEA|nr:hypothetical protein KIW84_011981 [Pisum sativum]KAI5443145.1 hypothetical protein KIW84_011982 [Pisum sativum]
MTVENAQRCYNKCVESSKVVHLGQRVTVEVAEGVVKRLILRSIAPSEGRYSLSATKKTASANDRCGIDNVEETLSYKNFYTTEKQEMRIASRKRPKRRLCETEHPAKS